MATFLLTWHGTGALDLSQVLDQRGQPILFPRTNAHALVHSSVLQHPFVKRYLKEQLLKAVDLDSPAMPIITPPVNVETVIVKENVAIKATPITITEPVTEPVTESVTEPVTEPVTESVPLPTATTTTFLFTADPVPLDNDEDPITTSDTTSVANTSSVDPIVESTTKSEWKKSRRGAKR